MLNNAVDKTSLKYLGEEYQFKLVKEFMEDKSCFKDLAPIIDQNMFTGQYLRIYVGTMLEYLKKHGDVPSYTSMSIELRQKAHTQTDIEICDGIIKKIKETPSDGSEQTRDLATKFFKQQNIIKAANEMLRLAGNGDLENYDKCEELLRNALNTGNHEDYEESRLFDGIDETLSSDSRIVIPTGIGLIDDTLNGGIGKGELGCIVGPSGYGKVQPYDSKIVTPNGYVEMRDIKVGSLVIGADGKAHKVTAVFPHENWDFYKVTFSDGVSTECGKEHLWNVNTYWQRTSLKHIPGKSYKTSSGHYKKFIKPDHSYKTMSLEEIMERGLYRGSKKAHNFKVQMPKPVEFNEIPVAIDPYTLGCMIGDGSFNNGILTVGHEDINETINNLSASTHSFTIHEHSYRAPSFRFKKDFKDDLSRYYDLSLTSGNKYIHHDYLYNSLENRIALLNGLMDTDGTCSKKGYCSYSTKSKQLAEDVKQLVLSLGGFARVNPKQRGYKNKKTGLYVDCGIHYEVYICLYDKNIPIFRLKRKQDRVKYHEEHYAGRFIESVEYSRKADGQCIMVDSDDHLYLTDDFIVTHNTTVTTSMALHASTVKTQQNDYKGFKVLQIVFEDRIKQIQRKHFSKLTQVEACNLSKEEYAEYVQEILKNYPERELIQDNLRIIRLKSGEKSVDFIYDLIRKHINQGFRPDLVIIDYFECIKLTGQSTMSKWDKEAAIMRKLESIVNELNIAIWVPVQGNRDSINAQLVTMDNTGGSLGKIQVAHIIMSITRSLEDIADNIATISILKNRAGSSGRVIDNVIFNNGTCTISTDSCEDFSSGVDFNRHKEKQRDDAQKDLTRDIFNSIKMRK